jgi:hypothetical protein
LEQDTFSSYLTTTHFPLSSNSSLIVSHWLRQANEDQQKERVRVLATGLIICSSRIKVMAMSLQVASQRRSNSLRQSSNVRGNVGAPGTTFPPLHHLVLLPRPLKPVHSLRPQLLRKHAKINAPLEKHALKGFFFEDISLGPTSRARCTTVPS